jgi:hypothetical protein
MVNDRATVFVILAKIKKAPFTMMGVSEGIFFTGVTSM